ncbi:MAG: hypothetical protein C0448_06930 [Sphingobacteriaceae bacterium]|nr:hypothetical protein [Sphingobacteriaceae bacterium]
MKLYTLKELLQIKNGRDHKELGQGNIPVFGSGGLMRYADKSLYEDESILLPRKGTLSNIQYTNKPFWTVDTLYYTIVNKQIANPFYLFNYLKNLDLSGLNSGTGVPSMTFDAYYNLEIWLPEIEIQKQITSVLSTLDSKIELNNKINAELEAMAKTIYDYWFIQFDFPNAKGKPYKSSGGKMVWNEELKREIPEGWEVRSINEIIEVKDGTHDSPKSTEFGYKLITSKNLQMQGLDFESANLISDEDYMSINKRSKVDTGDILFSMIGNIGTVYKVEETEINFAVKNVALYKTSQNSEYKNYVYMYLKSIDMDRYLKNTISGSIQKFIGLGSLRNTPFLVNDSLVKKYVKVTNSVFEQLENLKKENQQLASLRDWLLPMLMNGQVKVGDAEKMVAEKLSMAAEEKGGYEKTTSLKLPIPETKKSFAKQVLAGKIMSLFREEKEFTDIKFQKIQYLAEHIAETDLNWNYFRKMAGPYDNKFMHTVYTNMKKNNWFEDRKKNFKPLAKVNDIDKYYQNYFSPVDSKLTKLFNLLKNETEAYSEVFATVYAIWNNLIINKEKVTDEKIVKLFFDWSTRKETYTKKQITDTIKWIKDKGFEPTGFGHLIKEVKGK